MENGDGTTPYTYDPNWYQGRSEQQVRDNLEEMFLLARIMFILGLGYVAYWLTNRIVALF